MNLKRFSHDKWPKERIIQQLFIETAKERLFLREQFFKRKKKLLNVKINSEKINNSVSETFHFLFLILKITFGGEICSVKTIVREEIGKIIDI